jgi:hyaluronan synthase
MSIDGTLGGAPERAFRAPRAKGATPAGDGAIVGTVQLTRPHGAPAPPAVRDRRTSARIRPAIDLHARLRSVAGFGGASTVPVRILDLGAGGARVEAPRWLNEGERVTLELPALAGGSGEGLPTGMPAGHLRARVREMPDPLATHDGYYTASLVFTEGRGERVRSWLAERMPWFAFCALILALAPVVRLKEVNVSLFWLHPLANSYGLLVTAFIVSRLVLALFYRAPRDTGHRPVVSVVVACKNEEASIWRTLECVYRSDYPQDRLEVIAVDDGSTDGTLEEMQRAAAEHPSLVLVSFSRNRGKRHAMAEGARRARGEVLVYVDSDSFLRPDAILKLASAFSDPEIAAVCGHADVQNARTNFLTKMQEVRYFVAFRVVKAAESIFSTVTCCSGCLAAYRRSAVMEVLDDWLDQTFLGVPATFGDDRSLTRYMLRRQRVIYHSEAICTTIVPDAWPVFFRQQLRWKKSWVRESLLLMAFMWKRHPTMAVSFYVSVVFPLVSPGIALHSLGLPLVGIGSFSFLYVYGVLLMAGLYALVYLARHRNGLWVYGILFSLFYMVALAWQTYYAAITVRQNQWGTR